MRKITSFLLCILLVLSSMVFVGCDAEPKMSGPEKALEEFEKAFNERDLDGIVKIFKPSQQSEIKLQMKLAQGFAGVAGSLFGLGGIGDLFSDDVLSGVFGVALEDYYVDIQVIDESYNQNGNKATVTVKIVSETEEETDTFEMVKISDTWYLDIDMTQ